VNADTTAQFDKAMVSLAAVSYCSDRAMARLPLHGRTTQCSMWRKHCWLQGASPPHESRLEKARGEKALLVRCGHVRGMGHICHNEKIYKAYTHNIALFTPYEC
jgi:hypothetical protein